MEPETPFLPEAGADPVWSEPESAARSRLRGLGLPEPEPTKKGRGSATMGSGFAKN